MSTKEEKPAVEPQKGAPKPEKKTEKKKKENGINTLYKIEGEKVTRLRPTCERCGPGYFMAKHQDRYTCGHCGFTRYKQSEQ
jgi:ubiquitin-small subunit ribosomal protein S27Ae